MLLIKHIKNSSKRSKEQMVKRENGTPSKRRAPRSFDFGLATSCLLRKINIESASVSDRRQFLQLIIKRINTLINTIKFA